VKTIRVAVVDDDNDMRSALADFIQAEPDVELLWTADGTEDAIRKTASVRPDVVLMDVKMPDGGGIRATKEIRAMAPGVRVVALSAFGDRTTIMEMLRAGAVGYVLKGSPSEDILVAIQHAAEGRSELSPEVSAEVVHELAGHLEREAEVEEQSRAITDTVQRLLADPDLLRIEFQPILELSSMRTVGAEALARFHLEPRRPPDLWFAEAERVGLRMELELEALRRAMLAAEDLSPSIYLSLNASPATVTSRGFDDTLALAGGRPLVIEVTEHAAIEDYDAVARGLGTILRRGGRLAVDDAGAGFASLRHILRLSPDIIKLDRSISADVDTAVGPRAMARALIEFAQATGASIVAEGIERSEELEALKALGVHFGQGYYLGRPMPMPDLEAFLDRTPAPT
jgi:EAL domain-containing protein (putative c-di-GMP-specific phosphodiesterase class I)/CheY-like chemotaxis protein